MTDDRKLGLYVHWPFCQSKCPYCDFNSHVVDSVEQDRWRSALLAEIARVRDDSGPRVLSTIFFGGGTPSLMPPETVQAVIAAARQAWTPANDMEITLEANPTSVEAGRFQGYSDAGVNRVSIGVQALNDRDLKALGRLHSAAEARAAFEMAQKTFPRVSFDLIYARQNQSLEDWRTELTEALDMAADHLSLYQLTVEPGTAFAHRQAIGGLKGLPSDNLSADMYELTQELTAKAGLPAYEVSNHAKPGLESQHNLIYWRSHDWLGVGPGAHGRFTKGGVRFATEAIASPSEWLAAVEQQGSGELSLAGVDPEDERETALMMGLRLNEGVPIGLLDNTENNKINKLEELSLLERTSSRARVTQKGRMVLNAVLRELLA